MKASNSVKPVVSVLLGTSEPAVENCLRQIISKTMELDFAPRFTIKKSDVDIREATTNHKYGLVVLFINTMLFEGGGRIRFDWALDLIRHVKWRKQTIVLTITTFRPPGFATAAEQAGADAIIDAPFTLAGIEKAIRAPMEARS